MFSTLPNEIIHYIIKINAGLNDGYHQYMDVDVREVLKLRNVNTNFRELIDNIDKRFLFNLFYDKLKQNHFLSSVVKKSNFIEEKNYASSLLSRLFFIVLGLKNQNQAQAPSPCIHRGDIGRRNHGYHQTVPMAAMVLPTRMCIIMVKKVAAGCGSSEC